MTLWKQFPRLSKEFYFSSNIYTPEEKCLREEAQWLHFSVIDLLKGEIVMNANRNAPVEWEDIESRM